MLIVENVDELFDCRGICAGEQLVFSLYQLVDSYVMPPHSCIFPEVHESPSCRLNHFGMSSERRPKDLYETFRGIEGGG